MKRRKVRQRRWMRWKRREDAAGRHWHNGFAIPHGWWVS